jgi:uncharacterized protein YjbI with pentapeptide repeats
MSKADRPGRASYQVLSTKTIWAGVLVLTVVAAGSVWVLLANFGHDTYSNRLDVIKTAGSIVIGTGGAAALLLTARRQRFVELDGTERRITDLQTKAAELLGSDQAAVRLAGLYALERLAQDNPSHRQTIVDIMCGYLRMPFTPPQHSAPPRNPASLRRRRPAWMRPHSAGTGAATGDDRRQEGQVRLTAQRILAAHLRPEPKGRRGKPANPKFWPHIDLDLTGATLLDFRLDRCRLRIGTFTNAHFTGVASFEEVTFTGDAFFHRATFTGLAYFHRATFIGVAWFQEVAFTGDARFNWATFTGDARFKWATFTRTAFTNAHFTQVARFDKATFSGDAGFHKATFAGHARFEEVTFAGDAGFDEATFTGDARFDEATFTGDARFDKATFTGDARFDKVHARTHPSTHTSIWPQGWALGNEVTAPQSQPTPHGYTWHLLVPTEVGTAADPSPTPLFQP